MRDTQIISQLNNAYDQNNVVLCTDHSGFSQFILHYVRIRFYHPNIIVADRPILPSTEDTHHMMNVLRVFTGQKVFCFNGKEEWECHVAMPSKKLLTIVPVKLIKTLPHSSIAIELMLCAIKREAMHEAISNATQMGVTTILPILSDRCCHKILNHHKMELIARNSSAQCGRIDVPSVEHTQTLDEAIDHAQLSNLTILWANEDESTNVHNGLTHLSKNIKKSMETQKRLLALIGPEGGFSDKEKNLLHQSPNVISVGISSNILRAETAVTALMQMINLMTYN